MSVFYRDLTRLSGSIQGGATMAEPAPEEEIRSLPAAVSHEAGRLELAKASLAGGKLLSRERAGPGNDLPHPPAGNREFPNRKIRRLLRPGHERQGAVAAKRP
jgi:hypothetical protein